METQKELEKAKIGLILNEPFFASAALRMEYVEDASILTGCTNGIAIKYNPKFFKLMPAEERKGFIAHEVMHVICLHPLRAEGKDLKVWNEACDYAINPLLKESGITLPKGGLFSTRFNGMSAEEIYKILIQDKKEDPQKDKSNGSGSGDGNEEDKSGAYGFGGVEQPPQGSDLKEMEQDAKQMGLDAYNAGKLAGNVPKGMKEIVAELIEPKHSWKEILNRFVGEFAKNDYTWTRPNTRYLPSGLYLPALESIEVGKIVFAIDTSGSIDCKLLSEFVTEIKDAMSIFALPVTVIHCDTKVQHVEEMTQEDDIVPVGRGGTCFQPVFDYVNEHIEDAKAIVYFTDGECYERYSEPVCPVLWAIYGNHKFSPLFGEVVYVEHEK